MKTLQERWGSRTAEKVEMVRGMVREAEAKWPGLTNDLNATGPGLDPRLIHFHPILRCITTNNRCITTNN
jgi:hypothetical protein